MFSSCFYIPTSRIAINTNKTSLFTSVFMYFHFIEKWNLYLLSSIFAPQLHHVVLPTVSAFSQTTNTFSQTINTFSRTINTFSRTINAFFITITAFPRTVNVHGMSSREGGRYLRDGGRLQRNGGKSSRYAGQTLRNTAGCQKDTRYRLRSSGKRQRAGECLNPEQLEEPFSSVYKNKMNGSL